MTPKIIKCLDQEKQDTFSCKHENTLKSMEFSEQLCLLTVLLLLLWNNGTPSITEDYLYSFWISYVHLRISVAVVHI